MLSRRDVIVSFLGLAAAESCRRAPAPPEVPGVIVDKIHTVGHLLRAAPPTFATTTTQHVDVLIIGAGAAGLSAAWRLRGASIESLLITEVEDVLGGTAQAGSNAVSSFPWGAHYLPAPLSNQGPVPRLLREFGVLTGVDDKGSPLFAEQTLIHEPEERLFYKGRWYEGLYLRAGATDDDLAQLRRFEAQMKAFAAAKDSKGRKAFTVPLELGSDDDEFTSLDRLTMSEWMHNQGFTSPRLTWLVDYACRDDYGALAAHVSAWAGIWYFCARQDGDEKNEGFLSWPEGNGRLIAQLAKAVTPAQVKRDVLIHTVDRDGERWVAHGVDAKTRAPLKLTARQVVLATPRHVAGRVVAKWRTERPGFLDAFVSGPWVVANLTLASPPVSRGFPLAWDNVLYESRSLGYVMANHQSTRARQAGPVVATWYYPLADGDVKAERQRLLGTTYEDWRAIVLADLGPAHPGFASSVQRIEVMRWGHAMVRPVPGFIWGAARQAAQRSIDDSMHFAHSDLGGLALFEEANWHGVRAAEQVLRSLKGDVVSWL
ncbi:MAG: twin-arginine translocation pathway signal [Archangium gephyra]|uniref:Twin-arginine translocation pathway signal n=1 Tax=Archangium gephyra TaxID=48 RepID=A0A2W5UAE9_9BACT|nr:MAG: twin-arginine translocation pathway signal [Archangium gephyra]